jgi:flagellar protein FliO/FliZ
MNRWLSFLLLAPFGAVRAADTPAAASPPGGTAAVVQMLGALGLVLAALFGALWLLRRLSGGRLAGGSPFRTVGGIAVGSRERVVLLEIGEHWLVVGVAPGSVTGIATLPRGEISSPDTARQAAPDFGAMLARLKAGRKS